MPKRSREARRTQGLRLRRQWAGVSSAAPSTTKLVGVHVRDMSDVKVFRYGANAVLHGMAVVTSEIVGTEATSLICGPIPAARLPHNTADAATALPVTLRFADWSGRF